MEERGRRIVAWFTPLFSVGVLALALTAGPLTASAVPYLSPLDVWLWPVCGVVIAAVAFFVAVRSRYRGAGALTVIACCMVADSLAIGLAQRSTAWVAIGAVDVFVVPAALAAGLAALRGRAGGHAAVRTTTALAAVSAAVETFAYDPGDWGWCRCVDNPLALDVSPASYQQLEPWLVAIAVAGVVIAGVGLTEAWVRRRGRTSLADALTLAAAGVLAVIWVVGTWQTPASPQLRTGTPAYLEACALLLLIAGYLVEALRRTPSRARVADLLLAAREDGNRAHLADLVARALGDPEATVWWWDPGVASYRDGHGLPQVDPDGLPASQLLTVRSEDRPLALVVGSRALPTDPRVMEPVSEALRLATENRRLSEELAASLNEVRDSRTRILTASDEARKRIERDLHDGAQQLLVATAATLNLAQSELDDPDAQVAKTLDQASDQLGRALTELRNLAGGITPTALVHGNLVDAVEDLALRCPVPVLVHVDGDRDPDLETSLTAYFVVAECLNNVTKHAGASGVRIDLALEQPFRVAVSDDGHGGAEPAKGSGLRGLTDRVEVRGGTLSFQSSSTGTTVTAILPVLTPEAPA